MDTIQSPAAPIDAELATDKQQSEITDSKLNECNSASSEKVEEIEEKGTQEDATDVEKTENISRSKLNDVVDSRTIDNHPADCVVSNTVANSAETVKDDALLVSDTRITLDESSTVETTNVSNIVIEMDTPISSIPPQEPQTSLTDPTSLKTAESVDLPNSSDSDKTPKNTECSNEDMETQPTDTIQHDIQVTKGTNEDENSAEGTSLAKSMDEPDTTAEKVTEKDTAQLEVAVKSPSAEVSEENKDDDVEMSAVTATVPGSTTVSSDSSDPINDSEVERILQSSVELDRVETENSELTKESEPKDSTEGIGDAMDISDETSKVKAPDSSTDELATEEESSTPHGHEDNVTPVEIIADRPSPTPSDASMDISKTTGIDSDKTTLQPDVSMDEGPEAEAEADQEPDQDESQASVSQTDAFSEMDDQSMDQDLQQENPVFVHVSSKNDGDVDGEGDGDDYKASDNSEMHNETGDESNEAPLAEEDPISISADKEDLLDYEDTADKDSESLKVVALHAETITSDKNVCDVLPDEGAYEGLCVFPDTEREISQEEKDAATAAAAAAAETPTTPEKEPTEANEPAVTAAVTTDKDKDDDKVTDATTDKPAESSTVAAPSEPPATGSITVVNHASELPNEETTPCPDDMKVVDIPENQAEELTCHQCCTVRKCLYKVTFQEKTTNICSETCLISFRTLNKTGLQNKSDPKIIEPSSVSLPEKVAVFVRKCAECFQKINVGDEKILSWETMDFCNEDCLSRYQNKIGSHCANCKRPVLMSSLGKYCVRFGHDIRQFCCSLCLEEFKKGLKVCSYCQKDISAGTDGFLAPVGDKGQFKDFCTQLCMEKYDQMSNKNTNKKSTITVEITQCSVCAKEQQVLVLYEDLDKKHKFCSEPCFVAFKFVNNVEPAHCDMCKKYFKNEDNTEFTIYYDNLVKNFCCKTCQNIYIIANRRIVPCSWCKVKKYNFDMIKKICSNGQVLMMCSLNCLSLFQVSINAVSTKKMQCDYCQKINQSQYHLTMSDATIRNFCTYHCVMSFQNQFSKLPITLKTDKGVIKQGVVPAGGPKRYERRATRTMATDAAPEVQMPVISNVHSLANTTNGPSSATRATSAKINNIQSSQQTQQHVPLQSSTNVETSKMPIRQQVIIKAPPLPQMRNKGTLTKPILHTKGVSCRPHLCSKETQTERIREKAILLPVPVPIYIPTPLTMYNTPIPVPIPFPIPIPVPVFIPTTRNSAAGIMKEIKKIQVKIPTDPFEAELLMMAEMVAGEKKVDNTDSESDEDNDAGGSGGDGGFSPEAVDTSNTFGEDMLQMALKMATELDEPAVDLEGALTANTITASQNQENAGGGTEETVDDPAPIHAHHQIIDRQAMRGRKRASRQPRNIQNPKRGRRMSSHVEMPMMPPPQPSQPQEPVEKPDANMCLKYTFGVNAWKQWVTTKNAELEKSSRRVKLFKNEILQLTADELNYSLCLFVKEVRKPNGTEYAPDTIYYLCLGIQQYLFENGRIDNIFTDAYYEKFTDCLDEVARKFSVLYNDSHYIVTRVEEEHLWESKQLGAHSPHVLLSTLMFFNTKHFNLTTVDEHMQLSFSHIMKHWKRNPNQPGAAKVPGSRNVLLRFYPPQTTLDANSRKKKVYEQQENEENPLRCPVKLYEFYLSKCPESVKTRNDVFYLLPERSCVPDSPVWYSTMALGREALEKMLHRVKMVKEINVALLTS